MIRSASASTDSARLAEIYNHYVVHDTATFETEPVTADAMWARVEAIQGRGLPWLVAEDSGSVVGYAYAGPYRDRAAYRHTLESTVYLDHQVRRGGWGTALYTELLDRLRRLDESPHAPVHSVLGVLALPHPGSVALHERLGFEHVGTVAQAGYKLDRWIDVGFWQLVL
ncbi:N-acetyltransferase family protein [Demequina sp. SYSU T00039]|uniref:N-acetyltransferase family protein n=1 Tax=Demequina lignilytica TaxID=3051663 RepID=A0AAW7M956_9MICO|nr:MULTISPECIES: GNAT family N-acetyltransferase [unclassified Demequina]MDN4477732.1 N-acetyltransferase family protein [Demequina sp. SYSU T00039-1]MDN4487641.1 N-acetyltransferase family protein [Demequina sp. SYSU T00039]MDN4491352.1 N-acetyltransferase family protein [Demequina sp. SYSU T00068]